MKACVAFNSKSGMAGQFKDVIDRIAYCVIYVADLPVMVRFYAETLGLPIAEQNARFVAFR